MDDKKAKRTAGALDVRNIIGILMVVYGVILVLMGIFSDSTAPLASDVNANLWAGLALLAVGAVFLVWARLRPIVVPEDVGEDTTTAPGPPGEPPR
jgi:drug/metabolite transporter (DMT)-like permease